MLPTNPTYWLDPTFTLTAQSLNAYTVVAGIQTAMVELDPQNLISETSEADNIGIYAWESYAINIPTSTPTRTPTRTPTSTATGTHVPSPTPTASPTPSPTTDLCQTSGGGAMLTGFGGGAAAINQCPLIVTLSVGSTYEATIQQGEENYFRFPAIFGRHYRIGLVVLPVGDVDLYVSDSWRVSTTNYLCRPYLTGSRDEVCPFVSAPISNSYAYMLVHGFQSGHYFLNIADDTQTSPVSAFDGADSPVGPPDFSGWRLDQEFASLDNCACGSEPCCSKPHLGEDWNYGYGSDDLERPVHAIANGVVTFIGNGGPAWNGVVIIRHDAPLNQDFILPDNERLSVVWEMEAHLDPQELFTWISGNGAIIRRGQIIGVIGPTPSTSTAPHLHNELRVVDMGLGQGYSWDTSTHRSTSSFIDLN